MSMQSALQILGYGDVHHRYHLVDQPQTTNAWEKVVDVKYDKGTVPTRETFDSLRGGCAGVTDSPCAFFVEELLDSYPQAKVILVEGDIEKWFISVTIVVNEMFSWAASLVSQLDIFLGYSGVRVFRKLWLGYFRAGNASEVLETARVVYKEHYARVRRLVPSEQLLEYELGSGWKPLCDFLEKDKPEVEFPWINEAAALRKKMGIVLGSRIREAGRKLI